VIPIPWTISNETNNSVAVTDIPNPITIGPSESASLDPTDVLNSNILATNLAEGGLCITSFGAFGMSPGTFYPITYLVHASATEIQTGESAPFTLAPYSSCIGLINITEILSGSISIGMQYYDGTVYYGATQIMPSSGVYSAPGQYSVPIFNQSNGCQAPAAKFLWTVAGQVTFTLTLQLR
jgi:hypothetical protein